MRRVCPAPRRDRRAIARIRYAVPGPSCARLSPAHSRRDPVCVSALRALLRHLPARVPVLRRARAARSCRRRGCWSSPPTCPRRGRSASSTRTRGRRPTADFRWADAVFVVRHARPARRRSTTSSRARTRTTGRSSSAARRSRGAPSTTRTPTSCTWASSATPPTALIEHLDRHARRARRSQLRFETERAAAAGRLPDARLRADPAARVLHRQHPVLQRLPVRVRVLRHPGALRAQPAAEDAASRCCASST